MRVRTCRAYNTQRQSHAAYVQTKAHTQGRSRTESLTHSLEHTTRGHRKRHITERTKSRHATHNRGAADWSQRADGPRVKINIEVANKFVRGGVVHAVLLHLLVPQLLDRHVLLVEDEAKQVLVDVEHAFHHHMQREVLLDHLLTQHSAHGGGRIILLNEE